MAQKQMLRVEVYARALRASKKRERERMFGWARDAPDELAWRGRVRAWKALVLGWRGFLCVALPRGGFIERRAALLCVCGGGDRE